MNLTATPADHPVSLSNQPQGNIVKHFTINTTIHHLIAGLITLNKADLAKEIDDEIKADGGTGAVNVKVSYEMPFIYGFVNYITLDIYTPFELTVEGDVVK
jgi:hypothetical protein